MEKFFKEKCITPFIAVLIAIATALVAVFVSIPFVRKDALKNTGKGQLAVKEVVKNDELFKKAVEDATQVETDEIYDLVCLKEDDKNVRFENGKVLLISNQDNTIRYEKEEEITASDPVWCFSAQELVNWYQGLTEEEKKVNSWSTRLIQLLGENPSEEYTDFVGIWVDPEDVYRPAYQPDPTVNQMNVSFSDSVPEDVKDMFKEQTYYAYYGDAIFPWTRLGYTYDWADNGKEYGVSEFVMKRNSTATVAFDLSTDEFVGWLENGGK